MVDLFPCYLTKTTCTTVNSNTKRTNVVSLMISLKKEGAVIRYRLHKSLLLNSQNRSKQWSNTKQASGQTIQKREPVIIDVKTGKSSRHRYTRESKQSEHRRTQSLRQPQEHGRVIHRISIRQWLKTYSNNNNK